MTSVDEIERAAMTAARTNQPNPPSDLLDCFLYLAFYSLYATFFEGQITREQAAPVKQMLIKQYISQKRDYDFKQRLLQSSIDFIKRVDTACCSYALDRTLGNADRLWAAASNLREECKPKNAGRDQEAH